MAAIAASPRRRERSPLGLSTEIGRVRARQETVHLAAGQRRWHFETNGTKEAADARNRWPFAMHRPRYDLEYHPFRQSATYASGATRGTARSEGCQRRHLATSSSENAAREYEHVVHILDRAKANRKPCRMAVVRGQLDRLGCRKRWGVLRWRAAGRRVCDSPALSVDFAVAQVWTVSVGNQRGAP